MGLYDNSPALDRIPTVDCSGANGIDQRLVNRPKGAACDVGAFEGSVGPEPPPASTDGGTTTPTTPVAPKKKCKKKKKRSAVSAKKKCKKKKR